jgi:hypothetical protein
MTVFRVVAPCGLAEVYRRFRGTCCCLLTIFILATVRTRNLTQYEISFISWFAFFTQSPASCKVGGQAPTEDVGYDDVVAVAHLGFLKHLWNDNWHGRTVVYLSQDISELRWPSQIHSLTASQPRDREGGETIAHASCSHLPFPSSLHLLLWRSSGSQIFRVQYAREKPAPVTLCPPQSPHE